MTYYRDCGYSKNRNDSRHHRGRPYSITVCLPWLRLSPAPAAAIPFTLRECGYSYRANETPARSIYEYQKDAGGHWLKCSFCTDETGRRTQVRCVDRDKGCNLYTTRNESSAPAWTCGYADEAEIPVIGHAGHFVISFEGTDIGDMLSVGASHKVPELPVLPPKEEGNLFDGWTDQKTGAPVKAGDVLTGDIVLTPVWKDCGDGSHTDSGSRSCLR